MFDLIHTSDLTACLLYKVFFYFILFFYSKTVGKKTLIQVPHSQGAETKEKKNSFFLSFFRSSLCMHSCLSISTLLPFFLLCFLFSIIWVFSIFSPHLLFSLSYFLYWGIVWTSICKFVSYWGNSAFNSGVYPFTDCGQFRNVLSACLWATESR